MSNFDMGSVKDLAKSDTDNALFNWVMVTTTTGSVIVDQEGGNSITLAAVPVGVWVPVGKGTNIKIASTAVGFMVV